MHINKKVILYKIKLKKKKENINTIFSQIQCLYTKVSKVEIPCSWNPLNFSWILTWGMGKILVFYGQRQENLLKETRQWNLIN